VSSSIHRSVPWNKGFKRVGVPIKWTEAEDEILTKGLLEGKSYVELAMALGKGEKTTKRHAEALGLRSNHISRAEAAAYWTKAKQDQLRDMIEAGYKWSEIIKVMGRSEANLRIWAKRIGAEMKRDPAKQATNGKPWTPEEDQKLLSLVAQGLQHTVIAERLGRPSRKATEARMAILNRGGARAKCYEQKPASKAMAERVCLGPNCRGARKFLSKGPENRMCQGCRESIQGLHMGHV
jgi:DNA-binding NarL/FixJ family response regulator